MAIYAINHDDDDVQVVWVRYSHGTQRHIQYLTFLLLAVAIELGCW